MKFAPMMYGLRARVRALHWLFFALLVLGCGELAPMAQPTAARAVPGSATVAIGSTVTFCVEGQGPDAFSYQWQKNGLNLPGETNSCITVANIMIADGASYRATVFNSQGALESDEAVLIVNLASLPGGDRFLTGQPINAISNSVRGFSEGASRELSEPFHFNLRTSNSVWYVWKAPVTGIASFNTQGSTFDTVLSVYTGTYLSTLTEVASDDDSGGFHSSRVSWNADAGTEYRIALDGVTGETGAYVCQWNLEVNAGHLPVITQPPRSQTVPERGTAFFEVSVSDTSPGLTFQWFRNGIALPGATSSSLTIYYVSTIHLGQYSVAVTNSTGRTVRSRDADLEIGPISDVQSKDKLAEVLSSGLGRRGVSLAGLSSVGAFSLSAGTTINQRFVSSGTADRCEPAHCGAPGGASRWFQLAPDSDGICTIDTQGSDVDTILAVYLQNFSICTNLYEPLVDCNNDALGTCDQILAQNGSRERGSRLSFLATAGTVYRAVVDTVGGVRGTNVQFHVHFESDSSLPESDVQLGASLEQLLQVRGSSLALRVGSPLASPTHRYEWHMNGRRIAGAVTERLVLPLLNYFDAGHYSVTVRTGTNEIQLPGAVVAIVDPCQSALTGKASDATPTFRMLGTTPESISLEAAGTLDTHLAWKAIGPIRPSIEPTIWDVSTGSSRFYRVTRPPP